MIPNRQVNTCSTAAFITKFFTIVLFAGICGNNAHAQQAKSISIPQIKHSSQAHPLFGRHSIGPKAMHPEAAPVTANKTTNVTYHDWYDMWDQNFDNFSAGYYFNTAEDSNLIDPSTSSNIYCHGLGMSFDPSDDAYFASAQVSQVSVPFNDTAAFTIDSFYVNGRYIRNNPIATIVDSIIVDIEVTTTSFVALPDSGCYKLGFGYQSYFYANTADGTPRFATPWYTNTTNDCYANILTTKQRYAFALDATTIADSVVGGDNPLQFGLTAPFYVAPYSKVVAFVHFKSGVAYPLGTSTDVANYYHLYASEPYGAGTWFPQSASNLPLYEGSYQAGLIAQNQTLYSDTGFAYNGHNVLIPAAAFNGFSGIPPGFDVPYMAFHINWPIVAPHPSFVGGPSQTLTVCENSTANPVNSLLSVNYTNVGEAETWYAAVPAVHGTATVTYSTTSTGGTITPIGLTYTPTPGYAGTDSFTVGVSAGVNTDNTVIHVTVTGLPNPGTINGASGVCVGSNTVLTSTVIGGTWSASNTNASVSAGTVTGNVVGTDTIKYTVTSTCGSSVATFLVTIDNAQPAAGTISGLSSVCAGSTIQLSESAPNGVWAVTNGNGTISATGLLAGVTAGTAPVTYTVTNGCGSATATQSFTVNPLPDAGAISGASNGVCIGSTITLSESASGGTWAAANGNATITSGGVLTGVTAGSDPVTYTVTNSCGTDVATAALVVNPLPTPTILVTGSTLSTSVAYTSFQWLSVGTPIPGATNSNYVVTTSSTYAVTVTDINGCTGTSTPQAITVGIENLNIARLIKVFPNPAESMLYIESPVKVDITLTGIEGKVLLQRPGVSELDMSQLPAGSYLLNIYDHESGIKIKTETITRLGN